MALDAINKAGASRTTSSETVIHSDHGSHGHFTSWAFTENARHLGLLSSMKTVGDCYDNAPMESFRGSVQVELLDWQKWRTKLELAIAMAEYIEHFYSSERRHSSLGYLAPNDSRRGTQPPSSRPLCPEKWSTEWGQAHMVEAMVCEFMT